MDLCRAKGVISYEGEGFKLLFGPAPATPEEKAKAEAVAADPQARKRAHYCNLLGRETIGDDELKMLPDGF